MEVVWNSLQKRIGRVWHSKREDICRTKKGEFKGRKNDVSIFEETVIG
jgi:hypothetical protein